MTENNDLVKNLAECFQTNGLEVLTAKCNGFEEPPDIQGIKPDVVGWDSKDEVYHLAIVADSNTFEHDYITEKITVLSKQAMGTGPSYGKRLPFYVGVTKDANAVVDKKLQEIDQVSRENIKKILI
ncbi:hypothetical protein [Candidatus Nitrosopumilus sediminis]|uniref:Uncharacterized protein n=1 Tax=Candidatus Nitrosopumilus sediminis TaxID=1229909 RepID=K0B7T6_9ARCH|nr:hypothetical protein [Candidatus Nitrosopumilus sediminis]AFS82208.1 hypothetical protein NSED_01990 [Candidatus Nitrosopumilus sediminis]